MKPREFKMIQVMTMRLSQALDSSTVRPDREKFIIRSATAAVTMAAMVEMPRILVYTSFITSLALVHISVAAAAGCASRVIMQVPRKPV